jgi:hypothetical protein
MHAEDGFGAQRGWAEEERWTATGGKQQVPACGRQASSTELRPASSLQRPESNRHKIAHCLHAILDALKPRC